jgi:hypothetical protein
MRILPWFVDANVPWHVDLSGDHMRPMIFFFVALLAIPIVQVAFGSRLERAGAPVVIDRSGQIIIAVSKHLRARDGELPLTPRAERRPKPS